MSYYWITIKEILQQIKIKLHFDKITYLQQTTIFKKNDLLHFQQTNKKWEGNQQLVTLKYWLQKMSFYSKNISMICSIPNLHYFLCLLETKLKNNKTKINKQILKLLIKKESIDTVPYTWSK